MEDLAVLVVLVNIEGDEVIVQVEIIHAAYHGVKNLSKIVTYLHVNCAFSPSFSRSSCTHLNNFKTVSNY